MIPLLKETECSFGDFLYNSMKQLPRDKIFQTNGITGESETVQDALQKAVSVAEGLRKQGVNSEDVVAIVSNYSPNSIAATFGSLFLGASPFPIDPALKKLELQHMVKVANPKVVFIESAKAEDALLIFDNNIPIFLLDEGITTKSKRLHAFCEIEESSANVEGFKGYTIDRPSQQVVAVIPSSGTTGLPKGVALSHQSLFLHYKAWAEIFKDEDMFLPLTPLFWISGFSIMVFSIPLGYGRVYLNDTSTINILTAVQRYKPQIWAVAPIYLARILNYENLDKYDLTSLEKCIVGGTAVPNSTFELFKEKFPNTKISQAYGATEMGGIITRLFDEKPNDSALKCYHFSTYKIIDPNTKQVLGRNQNGELCFKSPTLLVRYLLNEKTTHDAIDSEGFYHTGDIGYEDDDQYIYITGRLKELIKVKNHQVSPAEIENVIRGITGVVDTAVVGIPHKIDQNHPRALVVKEPLSSLTEQKIINEVADKLSETKHLLAGAQFVNLLPRNVNGKLKRNELLALVKM